MKRFLEVDLLKVLAIIGMIIYHFFYIVDFLGVRNVDMHHGVLGLLGDVVRFLFVSLVGVTLVLSKWKSQASGERQMDFVLRRWKQAAYIFVFALIINLVTYIVVPDQFVKFGVLHLIAFGIFCGSVLANRPYLSAQIGVAIILVSMWTPLANGTSFLGYILGVTKDNSPSLDYFPVVPWLGVVFIGMLGGHWFLRIVTRRQLKGPLKNTLTMPKSSFLSASLLKLLTVTNLLCFRRFASKRTKADVFSKCDGIFQRVPETKQLIQWVSSKALLIYITHIPILLLLVYSIKMLNSAFAFCL